jgi:hypothetical protein
MQKRQTPEKVSSEERAGRQKAIDFARGSCRYEALVPTSHGELIIKRFIGASLTIKQELAAIEAPRARTS